MQRQQGDSLPDFTEVTEVTEVTARASRGWLCSSWASFVGGLYQWNVAVERDGNSETVDTMAWSALICAFCGPMTYSPGQ